MAYGAFSYEIKSADGETSNSAIDMPAGDVVFDLSKMCATGLLATRNRDTAGDIFEVAGCDTSWHRRNPVALLDHGVYYRLPIGKCEDESGNYTVTIDANSGDMWQTTYFSQHSEIAEQVFYLYTEKILRANSICYKELEVKQLPADPAKGWRGGKHILRSQLVEATWCGVPMNPDAVMRTWSADKICGKSICPEVKHILEPYILKKKSWVSVPTLPTKEPTMSIKSEPQGTQQEPADKPNDQTVPEDTKSEDTQAEPLGKTVLCSMSEGLKGLAEGIEKAIGPCEHDKVKGQIGKHLEALKAMCAKVDELHEKVYGKGGEEAGDDEEEEKADDDAPEDDDTEKDDEGDDDAEAKSLLSAFLKDSKLSRIQRTALGIVAKALDKKQPVKQVVEEQLTPAEQKELAQLERAIQRRIDLIEKL